MVSGEDRQQPSQPAAIRRISLNDEEMIERALEKYFGEVEGDVMVAALNVVEKKNLAIKLSDEHQFIGIPLKVRTDQMLMIIGYRTKNSLHWNRPIWTQTFMQNFTDEGLCSYEIAKSLKPANYVFVIKPDVRREVHLTFHDGVRNKPIWRRKVSHTAVRLSCARGFRTLTWYETSTNV